MLRHFSITFQKKLAALRKNRGLFLAAKNCCVLIAAMAFSSSCAEHDKVHGHAEFMSKARRAGNGNSRSTINVASNSALLSELKFEKAQYREIDSVVHATGQLQANANAVTRVSSPITGKVLSMTASAGDQVQKGQILLEISSQEIATLESELYKNETEIDSDLAKDLLDLDCDLQQSEAQASLYKKKAERANLLYEEKIVSLAELETARTELEKQRLSIAALKQKRERIISSSNHKKKLLAVALEQKLRLFGMPDAIVKRIVNTETLESSIPIRAPQGGIVLERMANVGELIDPSKTLFVVDDIDNLWLVADVFEQDIYKVKMGQKVEFTIDSFPNRVFQGQLNFVAGAINQETRTLAVRAEVANPNLALKPKMFARMKIFAGRRRVLTLPASALQDAGSRKVVYIRTSPTTFKESVVEIGMESGKFAEVTHGLKEGDVVVTNGSFSLRAQSLKDNR